MSFWVGTISGITSSVGFDRFLAHAFSSDAPLLNTVAVPIIFSILQCMLLIFTYETPKFLLQKKRHRAAERGSISPMHLSDHTEGDNFI